VRSLAFTPNITFLLTGSDDGNIRLWEMGSWNELGRIRQGGPAKAMVIHPDGDIIITNNDILATLWDYHAVQLLRPNQLVDEACSRLTRNLTRSEWEQYIGSSEESESQQYHAVCPNLPFEE